MGPRAARLIVIAASAFASAGAGPSTSPAEPAGAPTLSVARLRMSGATGRDKLTASFYVLAGREGIKDLQILPGDLAAGDGPMIAANNYQVAPATVATLDPGQAVLVSVTAGPAPASGTYRGSIHLVARGLDPAARLELPVELTATAKTTLELAPHPSPLSVRITRSIRPRWLGGAPAAEPAEFSLRQKADGPGRARVALTGPLDAGGPDAHGLPVGAVAIIPRTAQPPKAGDGPGAEGYDLPPGLWTTFRVVTTAADLKPGTYRGAVELSGDWDTVQTIPLEVTVRDSWVLPLLVLLTGFLLSFMVTYMATTGSALLQTYDRIDALRQRLARPGLLASDNVAEWRRRLDLLDEQARNLAQAQARDLIDALAKEIDQDQALSEAQLKAIRDHRTALDQLDEQSQADAFLQLLMKSPWAAGLRPRLLALAVGIQDGSLTRGVMTERLKQLDGEIARLAGLGATLPPAKGEAAVRALTPETWLDQVAGPADPRLLALIAALGGPGSTQPPQFREVVQVGPAGTGNRGAGRTATGWREWITAFARDPRNYLPVLSGVLSCLAVGLLLFTGLLTLYAGKPTFGSNWPVDYLGVFIWGLGSEAGRKQVGDLAPVLGTLRSRLGVSAAPG